ncbi:Cohesin subunit SA-3 [Tritrichomonas musculus]|uniref:Cohesin subunit SA-3 n=1 Tax=Tritrichomonas musculus TaxID=1915356 RepID=A0ABR2ID69_9EUKA
MLTRNKKNQSTSETKLTAENQSPKVPDDIIDFDQLNDPDYQLDIEYSLFDYLTSNDGNGVIKKWSKSFSKKENESEMQSYLELLSFILQISGNRINMNINQIKSNSFDTILKEFIEKAKKSKLCPPLYKFLKSKSKKIISFWKDISESLIANNVFSNDSYKHFMEWISAFNCCKIRVVRLCTTFFICSLFESLANSISWRKGELEKNQQNSKAKQNHQQNSLFEQEISLYLSVANDLYKNLLIVRIRDIDDKIRNLIISSLTNAMIICDVEFLDEQKLKYVGRALNDTSSVNRLDAIKFCEKIVLHVITESSDNGNQNENDETKCTISNKKKSKKKNKSVVLSIEEKNQMNNQIQNVLIEFSEMYSPRIIEMCNDSNEEVSAEAISCLGILIDKKLINLTECPNIQKLISDDSVIIRESAASFVAKRFFSSNENDDIDHFLFFVTNFNIQKELPFIVSSLYPYLKCLKRWDEMCDRLISEENDDQSKVISAILLCSARMVVSQVENCAKRNNSKTKNSQESINSEKAMKKSRKLTTVLIQNLPQLLKAYQSSRNKEIILNLIEVSSLLDLNAISESSCEKQYVKLLNQLHEIFIKCDYNDDKNSNLFNTTFNSIYVLSKSHSQLSEIAQKELDKLSITLSNFGSNEDDNGDERMSSTLAKFTVAARLIDISSNEKLKTKILHKLYQKMKKYDSDSLSESEDNTESEQKDDNEFISNSIECLQHYFKWDLKKVHDFLKNRKIVDEDANEIAEKIEMMKEPYIKEFHEFSTIFSTFLKSEKASYDIKLSAFKSLSAIISLSPILTYETATGLAPPFISTPIVNDDISDSFYSFYHNIDSINMKIELFDSAELPIIVKAIDIGYSAHLFIYNCIASESSSDSWLKNLKESKDNEYIDNLSEKVKKLWKKLSQYRPINGKQLYSAFSFIIEKSPNIKSVDIRRIARFFVGKFRVFDFIKEWSENKDEDEQFLPVTLTFLFGLSENEASQLRGTLSDRFEEVIDKISNGNKLKGKDILKLQVVKKPSKKKKNEMNYRMISKIKKDDKKVFQKQSTAQNNEDDDINDEIEIVESTEDDQIENNGSFDNEKSLDESENVGQNDLDESENVGQNDLDESENIDQNDLDDSDVQEIDFNNTDQETSDSHESEIEFEEPDESFIYNN